MYANRNIFLGSDLQDSLMNRGSPGSYPSYWMATSAKDGEPPFVVHATYLRGGRGPLVQVEADPRDDAIGRGIAPATRPTAVGPLVTPIMFSLLEDRQGSAAMTSSWVIGETIRVGAARVCSLCWQIPRHSRFSGPRLEKSRLARRSSCGGGPWASIGKACKCMSMIGGRKSAAAINATSNTMNRIDADT